MAGRASAVSALDVYDQVYTARNVDTAALRVVRPCVPAPAFYAGWTRATKAMTAVTRTLSK
jgi:hypothetical protein